MTLISAFRRISPTASPRPPSATAGYSLLEIIIVMALLALAATIAGPSVGRWVDQARYHAALQSLDRTLLEVRREAVLSSAPVTPDELASAIRSGLGDAWRVEVSPGLGYSALGYCPGGEVIFAHLASQRVERRLLEPGRCEPGQRGAG